MNAEEWMDKNYPDAMFMTSLMADEYARQKAVEFKDYILKNYGYSDREFTVPDEAYDEFNKQ